MHIVLSQPEIPQNTGNIARTCAVTGASLTLVRPLGFSTTEKKLKRAGLDYWEALDFQIVDTLEEALDEPFYFFSTKGDKLYTEIEFQGNETLVFGSESRGLPEKVWEKWPDKFYTIPMIQGARSLNLSNAVAIVAYEGWRQRGFKAPR